MEYTFRQILCELFTNGKDRFIYLCTKTFSVKYCTQIEHIYMYAYLIQTYNIQYIISILNNY
jgi:hypothetical protein